MTFAVFAAVLFQTFSTLFFSQFGFLFFLPPCSSKRFLLFFFPVWFSVFFAAVLFQTFSIWFFASAVFCFFARRAFSAPFFLLCGSPTVLFSRRSVRLACGKRMQPFAEKYTKVWSTSYGAYILSELHHNVATGQVTETWSRNSAFRSMPMSGSGGHPRGPGGGHGGPGEDRPGGGGGGRDSGGGGPGGGDSGRGGPGTRDSGGGGPGGPAKGNYHGKETKKTPHATNTVKDAKATKDKTKKK